MLAVCRFRPSRIACLCMQLHMSALMGIDPRHPRLAADHLTLQYGIHAHTACCEHAPSDRQYIAFVPTGEAINNSR